MKKFLIFSGIGVVVIVLLMTVIFYMDTVQTKSHSPEGEAKFTNDNVTVVVFYNRPYKKGRDIFGGLVPYGKVWRTGANEATTFETNKDLLIEGKTLKAGKYSLWTIPENESWTIIFNAEYGQWGINSKAEANRDPARDVLSVHVLAVEQSQEFEQFTISFEKTGEEAEMVLIWDKTLVSMPFSFR